MKPPPRKRIRPERELKHERGHAGIPWQRAEKQGLLTGLQRLNVTTGANGVNGATGDIDYSLLKKAVPTRSVTEIQSVVEALKNRVASLASFKLRKDRWEETKGGKPLKLWTHMASVVSGSLEESISSAFSQMLMVSSTEPCTLRNCDPPLVHRPPSRRTRNRSVPLKPRTRVPAKGRLPLVLKTPAATMGPIRRHLAPAQVVRVTNDKTPTAKDSAATAGHSPVAAKDSPAATGDSPATARDSPVAAKDSPVAAGDSPLAGEPPAAAGDSLVAARDSPVAAKDSPATARDSPVAAKDSPATARDSPVAAKDSPVAAKDSPAAARDSPVAAKDSPVAAKDSPAAARDSPVAAKDSPVAAKDSPAAARDSPVAARGSPAIARDSPVASKALPATARYLPVAAKDLPATARDSPVAARGSPATVRDLPVAARGSPAAPKDSPVKAKDLPVTGGDSASLTCPPSQCPPASSALSSSENQKNHQSSEKTPSTSPSCPQTSSSSSNAPSPAAIFNRPSTGKSTSGPGFRESSSVDFERIYRFLGGVHTQKDKFPLTSMESAVVLDLLMSLPEELPLLQCSKLHDHLMQVFQLLSSRSDSPAATEMFERLKSRRREAESGCDITAGEGKEAESQSEGGDARGGVAFPPLNPFMLPLELLRRKS